MPKEQRLYWQSCRNYTGYKPCPQRGSGEFCPEHGCNKYTPEDRVMVLILRPFHLGNIIKTTPVIEMLDEKYHGKAMIYWAYSGLGGELLNGHQNLAGTFNIQRADELMYMRSIHWDYVLSLDADHRSACLVDALAYDDMTGYYLDGSPPKIFATEDFEAIFRLGVDNMFRFRSNMKVPLEQNYRKLLLDNPEKESYPYSFVYGRGTSAPTRRLGQPCIGLWLGGSRSRFQTKEWPIGHWEGLATKLRGRNVVVQTDPNNFQRAAQIFSILHDRYPKHEEVIQPISDFTCWLKHIDCLVSEDNFGMHAAVGMGTPVVGLFGPTPTWESPIGEHGIYVRKPLTCGPCYTRQIYDCDNKHQCMRSIQPIEVELAINQILKETKRG